MDHSNNSLQITQSVLYKQDIQYVLKHTERRETAKQTQVVRKRDIKRGQERETSVNTMANTRTQNRKNFRNCLATQQKAQSALLYRFLSSIMLQKKEGGVDMSLDLGFWSSNALKLIKLYMVWWRSIF